MGEKTAEGLLYLFDRPTEPVFIPKGDKNVSFDIPENYLADRYRPLADNLSNRFGGGEKITVKSVTIPDIRLPLSLGRRAPFSLFVPLHRKMGARLIDVFMEMRTREDFLSCAVYCRDRMNPLLFIYAFSVALLHRPDTRNIPIPPLSEVFPEKYVDSEIFGRAREESTVVETGSRIPLEIPRDYTASNLEEEHRVAYFREDLGINLHHWHWHLVYPFDAARNIVDKDRRGELFYYMHQQIIARYNFERFSNNLPRVKRYLNFREPIAEGYFPKLDSLVSSRVWPARTANTVIRDIYREVDEIKFDIQDLERWRDRFFEAIHSGSVVTSDGQTMQLTESRGIDILGNMMEASILSVNPNLYGDLHNLTHVAISLAHDPDNRHLETFSVMGDSSTAMRDPVFYRWHSMVNDMFEEHKNTLPRYTTQQLGFNGVQVTSIEINIGQQKNLLATFWQQSDVDLSRGLDFAPRGSVFARFTHLQHAPFSYTIQATNSGAPRQGTVRIFMAPKFDERGVPFLFRDQKNLFIELDRYVVNLNSGANTIQRQSNDSSVTIPFERTFRNLEAGRPVGGTALEQFNYCGCGWPQHMLIPKGSIAGLNAQLFVMISDYEGDRVQQSSGNQACADASSYCGIRDSLYPDRRAMGFPFDRQPRDGVRTLQDFLTPNMAVQDVVIKFTDRTISPKQVGQNLAPRS